MGQRITADYNRSTLEAAAAPRGPPDIYCVCSRRDRSAGADVRSDSVPVAANPLRETGGKRDTGAVPPRERTRFM